VAEVAKGIIDIEINTGAAAAQLKSLQAQINAFNLSLSKQNKNQALFAADYAKELQLAVSKTGMFTSEMVKLSTAASTLDKTLSKGRSSLGQFFSAKFNKDSAAAAEVMGLAAERASRMQTQFIATSAAAKGMQEAIAVRPLAAFSSEMAIASQKAEIMSAMFKQGTTQLINFGKNVQWAGRQLMVGFTVPLTIFGNTAGKVFMDLEKQVVGFKKVYGDLFTTPEELNKNIDAVRGLAEEYTKYGIAAKDTIGLAAQAAAAGRQNADLTDAVAQATRLATLGQMDQNAALETTISLQSAFKLSGQELADSINFLNMVENQTVVSLQDLSAAIPRVAPVIVGLGGDVKDLAVFLAAMQEGGVDAAEGANALKSGLASLINPTKQATQMLAGMGINLDAIIQANKGDLMGTVMAFSQALSSLDQFSRQQALEQVFGKFQYAKLGALFDNISRQGSQASQVIATMGYTTEQLGATAEKELKTIEESFGVQLTAAVEKLKLAIAPIGEIFVKTAIPIVNFLTDIINKFNELSEGKRQFIAIATILGGVVIPTITMLSGLLLNFLGTFLKMGQAVAGFSKALVTGGPLAAIKSLTQGSKYLSLAEIDAAMAAQQFAGASQAVNNALIEQAAVAGATDVALTKLLSTYQKMVGAQTAISGVSTFTVGGNAAKGIRTGGTGFRIRRNAGGTIPGSGNTDTVPAMLTPGEFVVNKEATKENLSLLKLINGGNVQAKSMGGIIQTLNRGSIVRDLIGMVSKGYASFDDILKGNYPQNVKDLLIRYLGIKKSSQMSKAASMGSSMQRTHFGEAPSLSSLKDLENVLGKRGGGKANIARILVNAGIPIKSLTDDWILLPNAINQAARTNTTTPMNISSAIKSLSENVGQVAFSYKNKNSAFSVLNPNVKPSEFVEKVSRELQKYMKENGDVLITDDILTLARNKAYPNMVGAGKSTGIRLPSKSEIGKLAGVDVNSPNFAKAVNAYFIKNNIPLSAEQIMPKDPKKSVWWALQILDSVGGKATGAKNKFAASTGFNSGGIVPGSGNTDTVPAMLTPGEFVINKDATQKNIGMLSAINNGEMRGYAVGGIVRALGATVAGTAGYYAGESVGGTMGGIVGSVAVPAILGKIFQSTIKSSGVEKSMISLSRVIGGTTVVGAFAALGFAAYKLNKQVSEAENAGAKLTEAMYGTAESTEQMAEFFGNQTVTQAARMSAIEKVTGRMISPEAQQQALGFVDSEAGKKMLEGLSGLKTGGGDVVEALRNQLSAAIISGAMTSEQADAVALEVAQSLGDQRIAMQVSGELNQLLGPDGKDILKNLSTITAEISPKMDATKIAADASKAYEDLNLGQKFMAAFRGGEAGFERDYQIKELSASLAVAYRNEASALEVLNLAYQNGKISIEEFNTQRSSIISAGAKSQDESAKLLGFGSYDELVQASKGTEVTVTNPTSGEQTTTIAYNEQQRAAQRLLSQERDAVKQMLEDSGALPEVVDKIMEGADKLGESTFGKILGGEINVSDIPILVRLSDAGLDEAGIENVSTQLAALSKIPQLDMLINLDTASAEEISLLNDQWTEFEKNPDIYKKAFVESQDFIGSLEKMGISYDQFNKLPDIQKFVVITEVQAMVTLRADMAAGRIDDAGARQDFAKQISEGQKQVQSIFDQLAQGVFGDGSGTGSGGGGGFSDMIANLMNRFDLVDKRLSLEARGYQDVIKLQERQNEMDQRSIELNNRALSQLSKKESEVNKKYDERIALLDGVAESNNRLKEQESSRIDLAKALAEGNVSNAAQIMSQITANEANYRIEDTRAALEKQKEEDLKNLRVEVNGQLLDREQIQANIDAIEEQIYQRNILIQSQQDQIYAIEQQRLANSREREKVETRLFLLEQRKNILELERKGSKLKASEKQDLANYRTSYNQMVDLYNSTFGESIQRVMYGGKVKMMAFGGNVSYRGSNEAPPTLKMAFGSMVPGKGNIDRVPALLTPGEFVVRKSAAQTFMPLLEMINNGAFPSMSGPSYNVPNGSVGSVGTSVTNSSVMYNDTYNINVNVAGTNSSPEDIANVVMAKLSQTNRGSVRGIRY